MGGVVGKSNAEGANSNDRQYSSDDSTERYYALIMMLELAESCLGSETVRKHVDESVNVLLRRCMNHEVIVKLVDSRVFAGRFRALSSDGLKIGLEDAYNRDLLSKDGAPDSKKIAFQVKEVADIRAADEGRKWTPQFLHEPENAVKATERLIRPDSTVNLPVGEEDSSELVYDIIQDRFVVGREFTYGAHGTIHIGFDRMNGRRVAIKFSNAGSSTRIKNECAVYESFKYRELAQWNAFPHLLWHGKIDNQRLIVMQLLGPSLKSFYAHCDYYLPFKQVFLLGEQMVRLLETLHTFGWLHRDLKPENFVMGLFDEAYTLRLLDFSLAKKYLRDNGEHIEMHHHDRSLNMGTARYRSLNALRGVELSRRDDLESLGYILVELLNASLPWHDEVENSPRDDKEERNRRLLATMEKVDWLEVCPQMTEFFAHCRSLDFEEEPNYEHLVGCLRSSLSVASLPRHVVLPVMKFKRDREHEAERRSQGRAAFKSSHLCGLEASNQ